MGLSHYKSVPDLYRLRPVRSGREGITGIKSAIEVSPYFRGLPDIGESWDKLFMS